MSMAKGLLPDNHPQSAGAARSLVLKEADVVVMMGALNWLLSHGKGKTWGAPGSKKFIQIDIEATEMDSNVEIAAPLVGDIGSCLECMLDGMGDNFPQPPADWIQAVNEKKQVNLEKMAGRLKSNANPMDFHGALGALREVIKDNLIQFLSMKVPTHSISPARSLISTSRASGRCRLYGVLWESVWVRRLLPLLKRVSVCC